MSFQRSTKVDRRPAPPIPVAAASDSMPIKYIRYADETWPVPINYADLGYTHGVFGMHIFRGAMCLRWQKGKTVSNDRVIASIRELYGEGVTGIEFIPIEQARPLGKKKVDAV